MHFAKQFLKVVVPLYTPTRNIWASSPTFGIVNLLNFIPSLGVKWYLIELAFPWWLMVWSTFSCAYWPFGWPLFWSVCLNLLLIFLLGCLPFSYWSAVVSFLHSRCALTLLLTSANYFCKWVHLIPGVNECPFSEKPRHRGAGDSSCHVHNQAACYSWKVVQVCGEMKGSRDHMLKGTGPLCGKAQ